MFDWPYYEFQHGKLYIRRGGRRSGLLVEAFKNAPRFATAAEAEAWLVDNDIRGNVR